jgi:alanine racemase
LNKDTFILAMVKAQSYGGGIVEMAQFLETQHVNYFGVAYADEGVVLRKNDVATPIIVMNPESDAFNDIIDYKLEPSIYSLEVLDEFIRALGIRDIKSYPIHLKLDTGMNRLGFVKDDLNELIAHLKAQPEVFVKSVFSHLAVADDLSETKFTEQQISTFKNYSHHLKSNLGYSFLEHIANSAATLNYPDSHFDMVRLGIGMHGLIYAYKDELEEVMSFETQISQVKQISQGDSVGYGRTFVAEGTMEIATIPVGYADGLRRELSQGKWSFIVKGQRTPIIGNICMDMCMVDVSGLNCHAGDSVQIFGKHNSVTEMAKILQTIPYEIISSISNRVHRVYLGLT